MKLTIGFFLVVVGMLVASHEAFAQREIPSAASAIADDVVAASKKTIAVVDFTDLQGNVTELGRFIAEEMALRLVTARKGLSVVDRTHLRVLMQENKLDATGVIDPATARKIGQILGVEALVTGTITPFADTVHVVAKVLDTTTARIISASDVEMSKNRTIEELLGRDIRSANATPSPAVAIPPAGAARATATSRPSPPAPSSAGPSPFQNGGLRVSVGQMGVARDNRRANVSLIVENISEQPILMALASGSYNVTLADDVGSGWYLDSAAGIPFLQRTDKTENESAFTLIQPGGRITAVFNFNNNRAGSAGATTPGRRFSISASAVMHTSGGHRPVSIGLSGIPVTD